MTYDDDQMARQLAWLLLGDRMPMTYEDELLVQQTHQWIIAAQRKLRVRGYELCLNRLPLEAQPIADRLEGKASEPERPVAMNMEEHNKAVDVLAKRLERQLLNQDIAVAVHALTYVLGQLLGKFMGRNHLQTALDTTIVQLRRFTNVAAGPDFTDDEFWPTQGNA